LDADPPTQGVKIARRMTLLQPNGPRGCDTYHRFAVFCAPIGQSYPSTIYQSVTVVSRDRRFTCNQVGGAFRRIKERKMFSFLPLKKNSSRFSLKK